MSEGSTSQLAVQITNFTKVVEKLAKAVQDSGRGSGTKSLIGVKDYLGDSKDSVKLGGTALNLSNEAGVKKFADIFSKTVKLDTSKGGLETTSATNLLSGALSTSNEDGGVLTAAEEKERGQIVISGFSSEAISQLSGIFKGLKGVEAPAEGKKKGGGFFSNLFSGLAGAAKFIGPVLLLVGGLVAVMIALSVFGAKINVGQLLAIAIVLGVLGAGLYFLADKIEKVSTPMLKIAIAFGIFALALWGMSYALNAFANVSWESILKGLLIIVAVGLLSYFAGAMMLEAGIGMAIFALGLIGLAFAFQMLSEIDPMVILLAFLGLVAALLILSLLAPYLLPGLVVIEMFAGAMLVMAIALLIGAAAIWVLAKGIEAFGEVSGTAIAKAVIAFAALGAISPLIFALGIALMPLGIGLLFVGMGAIMFGLGLLVGAVAVGVLGIALVFLAAGMAVLGMVSQDTIDKVIGAITKLGLISPLLLLLGVAMIPVAYAILLVAAAVLVLAFAFLLVGLTCWAFGEDIVKTMLPLMEGFRDMITGIVDSVAGGISRIIDSVSGFVTSVGNTVRGFIDSFYSGISGVINSIGDNIIKVIDAVMDSISKAANLDGKKLSANAEGIEDISDALIEMGKGLLGGGILSALGGLFGDGPLGKLQQILDMKSDLLSVGGGIRALTDAVKAFSSISASKGSIEPFLDMLKGIIKVADTMGDKVTDRIRALGLSLNSINAAVNVVGVDKLKAMAELFESASKLPSNDIKLSASYDQTVKSEGTLQVDMSDTNSILEDLQQSTTDLLSQQLEVLLESRDTLKEMILAIKEIDVGSGGMGGLVVAGAPAGKASTGSSYRSSYKDRV